MTIPAPGRALVLVGLGAALLSLYARLDTPYAALGFVALVPQLAALDRARSLGGALALASAMSVAWTIALFGWFPRVLAGYTQAPLWACWGAVLLGAPLWEPQLVAFAAGRYVLRRRHGLRWWRAALPSALLYVGVEWLVPKLFGDTLGHGLYPWRLVRQAADIAGSPGLTLALLLTNEALLATARRAVAALPRPVATVVGRAPGPTTCRLVWSSLRPAVAAAGLVAALAGYGAWRDRRLAAVEPTEVLAVGLVQANITRYDKLAAEAGRFEVVEAVLDVHFALSDELLESSALDVLVWPETVYPTTFGAPRTSEGAAFDRALGSFVATRRVPLIFGAYDVEDGREFNAAVFLSPAGEGRVEFDTYRKARLFPLTEWVPASLGSHAVRRWMPWLGTWTPGPGPAALQLPVGGARPAIVGPSICYETAFAGHALGAARRGAELLVTLSNDSWFAGSPAPRLHLALAAFRSIETRLWQVRATNSGISAVIAPSGDIVAAAPSDERAVISYRVPRLQSRTPLVASGEWLGPSGIALGFLALGSVLVRRSF